MYSYVINKILQAALVLLSVVSLVYVLQNTSVIDPVEDFLLSSFGDRSYDPEKFREAYEKEALRRNKHLPGFYFSIRPSYFPDSLYRIVHHRDRQFLKDLLRYSRCPSCVNDFIQAKENFLNDVSRLSKHGMDDPIRQYRAESVLLKNEYNLKKLDRLIVKISTRSAHDSIFAASAGQLHEKWQALLSSKIKHSSSPKMEWNGCQNQYHKYITGLLGGKFGKSKTDGRSAKDKIVKALKWTLSINITAFVLAGFFGLFLGLWSIKKDDSSVEKTVSSIFYLVYTMPEFWSATLLVIFFTTEEYGAWTNIFPSPGIKPWYFDQPVSTQIVLNAKQLALPVICILLPSLAYMSRIMKSKFSEVLASGFILTLRAKGLSENRILTRHVLKNGLIPFITIMTGSIPALFAGSLVIEIIFNIPGIGKLLFESILSNDWPIISGLVIMLSVVTVSAYLLADILYSRVNPKINVLKS